MAAAEGPIAGIDGVVLRNSGTYGSPTWAEIDIVKDVQPAGPWDMVEAGSRETNAKLYAKTRQDVSYTLTVRADHADTGYQLLYDAAMAKTLLDLLVLTSPVTVEGACGHRAYWNVNATAGPTQGADEMQYTTFELKPGWHSDGLLKVADVGSGSAVTFTAV